MENFFNQFRRNWHSRPDMPLAEDDWLALQKKLEEPHKKNRLVPGFAWFTIPFCFALTGLNVYFFNALKLAEQRVAKLEMLKDTVMLTRVINRTDTIWQTRILYEAMAEHIYQPYLSQDAMTLFSDNGNQPIKESNVTQIPSTFPQIHDLRSNSPERLLMNSTNLFIRTDQSFMPLMQMHYTLAPAQKVKSLRRFLNDNRPKSFSIAASTGLVYPYEQGIHTLNGWSIGLTAAVEFPRNLRLWTDVTHLMVNFASNRMDESIGIPQVSSPAPEFVFKEADLAQTTWQFSAGIDRYFILKNRRFQPFIGLGYAAVRWLPYEVSYDFIRQNDNVEWSIVKEVELSRLLHGFGIIRLGMGYDIAKKWRAEVCGTYRIHFRQTEQRKTALPGLQLGLRCFF